MKFKSISDMKMYISYDVKVSDNLVENVLHQPFALLYTYYLMSIVDTNDYPATLRIRKAENPL